MVTSPIDSPPRNQFRWIVLVGAAGVGPAGIFSDKLGRSQLNGRPLIDTATPEGLERLYVEMPAENSAALKVFRKRGFQQVARLERNIIDPTEAYHDLVVLNLGLA